MKEREQYLDTLRTLACILVVLTHSVPPVESERSSIHAFVSFICSPGSDLFFIISGALLLPIYRPTGEFLKKRFVRIFPPLLFWSSIVVIYRYFSQTASFEETWQSLISMPFKPVLGIYWFFYVISGLYLFAPIISKWLLNTSKKEIRFFLFLWSIMLLLTSISILFNIRLIHVNSNYYFILNNFGGFLGFMILGCYLQNYITKRTVNNNIIIPIVILFSLLLFAIIGYKMQIITSNLFIENLSLLTALMAYAIFMLFKGLKIKNVLIVKVVYEISICSYGIYLIHIFIARDIVWNLLKYTGLINAHAIITISLSLILSLAISYGVIRLIKLLPYSKYIIG